MYCFSSAVEYARRRGDYGRFIEALVRMGAVEFKPTVDVVDDCEVAVSAPIAVDAKTALAYGMINVPYYKGYALMDIYDYAELVHRWASSAVRTKRRREAEVGRPVQVSVNIPNAYPPCIKNIIQRLASGEEVEHMARFALVAFLDRVITHVGVDMKVKLISQYFANTADYDPRKTEYQVRHIMGLAGGGTKYSVPTCTTMKQLGLCTTDCGVRTPLQYYKKHAVQP
ncbi:MAG: hypothetical protein ACPL4I_10865, partial [Bacteroidota bacterium]